MNSPKERGFTIIEVIMFLAVTVMLIMAILIGSGNSINTQRYRDSVLSFKSFLQNQYTQVINVSNDSLTNVCYGDSTADNHRGQSNCVIIGRYITTQNNSNSLSIKTVLGYIPEVEASTKDDVGVLTDYDIKVIDIESEEYRFEWGASLVREKSNEPFVFSMLIVRSPISGVARTFLETEQGSVIADKDIKTLLDVANQAKTVKACVNSNSLFTGTRLAVIVRPNASSTSGIETQGDDSGCL